MEEILNYIGGEWRKPQAREYLEVSNPATAELLTRTPLCGAEEVDAAARAAQAAFAEWRRTPVVERVQYLFRLKNLLEENFEDLARTITIENGKTLEEARGEM
ncbi:MAG: aldehyde dehydrogenase family protein, partial [Anaerolineales bacterium]